MKYRIIIEEDEDGALIVECPALPGCTSQGKTRKEAIRGYLESLKKHDEPIPSPIDEEIVEVAIDNISCFCVKSSIYLNK
jgi:predicted RNase H-like HicB family nuclease